MSENINLKEKPTKRKLSRSAIVLITGVTIILIPCIVFASILIVAAIQTGTPRDGDRYKNDLPNKIVSTDIQAIEDELKGLSQVEKVEIDLVSGSLRVFIDLEDSTNEETLDNTLKQAYAVITSKLPVNTYFTSTDDAKNYDLNIHIYTVINEDPNREYKLLHKNAAEDTYGIDNLAKPKNPEIAESLKKSDQDNPDSDNPDSGDSTTSEENPTTEE